MPLIDINKYVLLHSSAAFFNDAGRKLEAIWSLLKEGIMHGVVPLAYWVVTNN